MRPSELAWGLGNSGWKEFERRAAAGGWNSSPAPQRIHPLRLPRPFAPMAVAFTLEGCALQLANITLPLRAPAQGWPLATDENEPPVPEGELLPPALPPGCVALNAALAGVRALVSPALPFAAHALGGDQLRVLAPRACTVEVFKLLRAQAGALGLVVGDVKQCVSVAPLQAEELAAGCAAGLVAALLHAGGWHRLDEDRLLGASPLAPAPDGATQSCASLTLRVQACGPSRLRLLVQAGGCWWLGAAGGRLVVCSSWCGGRCCGARWLAGAARGACSPPSHTHAARSPAPHLPRRAEHVEFRHPACKPGASLEQRSARLEGTLCQLLPDLRPALIARLRPADAATVARLRARWALYGILLPPDVPYLVEVALDCDPDAPRFPFPPYCVLGRDGLLTASAKRVAPGVQAALARLRGEPPCVLVKAAPCSSVQRAFAARLGPCSPPADLHRPCHARSHPGPLPTDDLAATPFKFLGDKVQLAPVAHEWFPGGAPAPGRSRHSAASAGAATPTPAFTSARQVEQEGGGRGAATGPQLALGAELRVADFAACAGGDGGTAAQRPRKVYAPVSSALQAAFDEAKRRQAEAERPVTARPAPAAAAAAPSASTAPAKPQSFAQRAAAAVAAGGKPAVPTFKKVGGVAPALAPKQAAAAKRPAGSKPPTAGKPPTAKRPKAPAAAAGATAAAATSAAAGGGGTASAAPEAAPAKPRAKAADIDVAAGGSCSCGDGSLGVASAGSLSAALALLSSLVPLCVAVTAKVQAAHAAGTLGKLTIPELKAYLKTIKQPVGGKKGDLEQRVRASLGGGGGGAAQ